MACSALAWWLAGDGLRRWGAVETDGSTIRFAHFGGYQDYELWRDVIAAFEHDHPGVCVRQEYVVGLSDHYNVKLRQQILTGTLPDVALIQLGPFRDFGDHFADLSEPDSDAVVQPGSVGEGLEPGGLAAFRLAGRQRGLPVSGGNLLIYANRSCFERASRFHGVDVPLPGDDWTVEDFRHTAELLTCDFDGDGSIDQFGFWHPRWIYFLPFLWSFGADLTDESMTQWTLQGPGAEAALTFYRDLLLRDHVCPRLEEVPQLFQDVGFLTGRVAMCVNGPWFQPFLARTRLASSYIVASIPTGPGGRVTRATWDGVVMAPDLPTARRTTARQFIGHILSRETQDRIARSGRALPALVESAAAFAGEQADDRRRRFVDALAYSRVQPPWPRFGQVDRAINTHFAKFVTPGSDPSAASMLSELSRDPVIVRTFSLPEDGRP